VAINTFFGRQLQVIIATETFVARVFAQRSSITVVHQAGWILSEWIIPTGSALSTV